MIDLTQPAGRRELAVRLEEHAVHIARLATALPQDLPSQVAGSNLVSGAVQALQYARRFLQEPTDERFFALAETLDAQFTWLDLLAAAELAQPAIILPHRERVLEILADAFHRTP
jgi:hypothetical protein